MDALPLIAGAIPIRRGRPPIGEQTVPNAVKKRAYRMRKREKRLAHIAVLDLETDPFTDDMPEIRPFAAEIYSDQFGSIVIWDDDPVSLMERVYDAIESLPDRYTIYAHNGGKFDFMYLVHKLRGVVRFKGRAIMSARIGNHELRDSLHILPEKLAAWKKEKFDYAKMRRSVRHRHRDEILAYLHSDCVYLFDFIKRFTGEFGLKISIGQAAFAELRKHYKIAAISEKMDTALRPYFFGGRVECIAGQGYFASSRFPSAPYKLYDVNSLYPYVMAHFAHPVSPEYVWHRGEPNDNTVFIDLSCLSHGALYHRDDVTGEVVCVEGFGRFKTTIWEYRMALKYGLIENVQIRWCIDNFERTTFVKFILPIYARREETKEIMKRLEDAKRSETTEYEEIKKENIFLKYLQNNSYGKTAQNPRKYKEYCYTDHGSMPDPEWFNFMCMPHCICDQCHPYAMPIERNSTFDIWARPNPGSRYYNVGCAASITGAARAILMEAKENAIDPIYCDTDSLTCRGLKDVEIHHAKLGAWKLEDTFDDVLIVGKKTYVCSIAGKVDCDERRLKVRSKGCDLRERPRRDGIEILEATPEQRRDANVRTWTKYLDMLDGQTVVSVNRAPTFSKSGTQTYLTRRIRATAPLKQRDGKALKHARGV